MTVFREDALPLATGRPGLIWSGTSRLTASRDDTCTTQKRPEAFEAPLRPASR